MEQFISASSGCLSETHRKSNGDIRNSVFEVISSFEQDRTGRGPTGIRGQLIGDLLVVRLVVRLGGPLTQAEQQLVSSVLAEKAFEEIQESADTDVIRLALEGVRTSRMQPASPSG